MDFFKTIMTPHQNQYKSETQKTCFKFLHQTSRSFSLVIQQLPPELLLPTCIFYLVLRGLDTIEDDPSIALASKEALLRKFSEFLQQDGWNFTGNRVEEKDRQLLVDFDSVIAEYQLLKPTYQAVITEITVKMGRGMAEYTVAAADGREIATVGEYDHYCWYVAGIVGQGLTQLFIESGFETQSLNNETCYRAMGLLLQKNNIIRDVYADDVDSRHFWPHAIWAKYVSKMDDLFKSQYRQEALNCSSDMILNALGHIEDCLTYLSKIHDKSIFKFCAIPQCMAIATLELCFRNGDMFEGSVKIGRATAGGIVTECSDMKGVCGIVKRYIGRIAGRNVVGDPNFEDIRVRCGEIEAFVDGMVGDGIGEGDGYKGWIGTWIAVSVVMVVVAWRMGS